MGTESGIHYRKFISRNSLSGKGLALGWVLAAVYILFPPAHHDNVMVYISIG